MAAVGVAVPEHLAGALREERLLDALGDDDRTHRHVARGQALGAGHEVGGDAEALTAEGRAETAEAADDLIRDQQHVVAPAELLHAGPEAVGRRDHAAGADHRLADHGRDAVAVILQQAVERVCVPPRDVLDVRHEVAVARAVGRDALQAGAEGVDAVIAVLAGDDDLLLGAAERRPVAAGELGRGVDGVRAAAGGEEDSGAVHARELGHLIGELEQRRVGERAEGVEGGQLLELRADRVGDLIAPVADVHVPQRGGRIEIGLAVDVPDGRALALGDHDLAASRRRHVRVPSPELCHVSSFVAGTSEPTAACGTSAAA